jgi:serine/threonine protein kinase
MSPDKIGRYQIKSEIGRGGMATVYLAHDPSSNREVAIKVLPREMMHNLMFRARFKRELKMVASLEHPAIVPIYDVGEDDSNQPYFVMRYMAGGSLADWIKKGALPLGDTALIVEQIAGGLEYAHRKNIIHRDIKPDNVLFDVNNHPYLTDFGIAKLTESSISVTGDPMGSPAYVSPEQAQGGEVDARSDIYGLGVMIFEMLTGKKPYRGDSVISTAVSHITQPVPDILTEKPDFPPEVARVIKTAMAKEKEQRYASALELANAFSRAVFGEDYTVPKYATIMPERQMSPVAAPARRLTGWVAGGALLLIAIVGWLGFNGQLPFLSATPTATVTLSPTAASTSTPVPTSTTEPTAIPIPPTPTATPIPGGADSFVFLSGNQVYLMNIGESAPIPVRADNSAKSNLQWMPDGKSLIYTSGQCVYEMDLETNETSTIVCFSLQGTDDFFEGFRISPDGKLVAITISRALYIVPFDREKLTGSLSRSDLVSGGDFCKYSYYAVKDIRWSTDMEKMAALIVDTQAGGTEQVYLLDIDIPKCKTVGAAGIDRFPFRRFDFNGSSIPSFDWNGGKLFLVNDTQRNDGFGNLYLYDSETQTGTKINPVDGVCCYRDARFSPDGSHILFAFQRYDSTRIQLYYIPFDKIGKGLDWKPIPGLDVIFLTSRDKPQPVLRPIQR